MMISSITADLVDWINSGYKGSPRFLNDPQGFFINSADQLTGAFIAGSGPLTRLCSPFSLDLRLNIALSQVESVRNRYRCTLKDVIANAKNARANVSINSDPNGMTLGDMVNGNVIDNPNAISVNGASIDDTDDYLRGDFNSGGWPAFVALTSEPQNNPYGAYMQAKTDLMRQQAEEENRANRDLDRGKGFFSLTNCKEIGRAPSDDIPANDILLEKTKGLTTLRMEMSGEYMIYKDCRSDTPGSIIAGKMQTSVDSPVRQLEIADSVGEIMDAALNSAINMIITKGLAKASGSSGGQISVTNNLRAETARMQERYYTDAEVYGIPQLDVASSSLAQLIDIYEETGSLLSRAKGDLESCFGQELGQVDISQTSTQIAAAITENQTKLNSARLKLQEVYNAGQDLGLDGFTTEEEQEDFRRRSNTAINLGISVTNQAPGLISTAEQKRAEAGQLKARVDKFTEACNQDDEIEP